MLEQKGRDLIAQYGFHGRNAPTRALAMGLISCVRMVRYLAGERGSCIGKDGTLGHTMFGTTVTKVGGRP